MRGGYLYQHRPDIVPHGRLTNEELCLWAAYHARREREAGGGKAGTGKPKKG